MIHRDTLLGYKDMKPAAITLLIWIKNYVENNYERNVKAAGGD